jgi:hypothetical protein
LPIFDGGRPRRRRHGISGLLRAWRKLRTIDRQCIEEESDHGIYMRSLATQTVDADRSVENDRKNYEIFRRSYQRGLKDYVNVPVGQI